jgi:hypothetical protein
LPFASAGPLAAITTVSLTAALQPAGFEVASEELNNVLVSRYNIYHLGENQVALNRGFRCVVSPHDEDCGGAAKTVDGRSASSHLLDSRFALTWLFTAYKRRPLNDRR